jgi:hypothetical protein
VRISVLYGGDDAKLSCGRLFNPEFDSDRSKALDHTHLGLSDVVRNQHFWLSVSSKMETSQVSLAYHHAPPLGRSGRFCRPSSCADSKGAFSSRSKFTPLQPSSSASNSSSDSPYAGG